MTQNKPKRSASTSSNEFDPFDTPENYYSDKNLSFNKLRTFSVIDNRSLAREFFATPIKELFSEDSSKSATPAPESAPESNEAPVLTSGRRPSIVPIYDHEVNSTTDVNVLTRQMERFSSTPNINIRRLSLDDSSLLKPRKFFISDVDQTLKELLQNEDTDHNYQITIEDTGPKVLKLGTVNSNGFRQLDVRGTYMLSNLLQELTIAKRLGIKQLVLDESRLSENPVARMKRLISTQFWKSLTRQTTKENIVEMSKDTKIVEEIVNEKGEVEKKKESHRIYVPFNREDQYNYFLSIKEANPDVDFDVQYLPEKIDAKYIRSINKKPGLLALASHKDPNDPTNLINEPYVVPGGRFNELYGWDSYMETLGLLVDVSAENPSMISHLKLARGMTENFIYEIEHYGKILNANRSYYLGRSQPPFLTDMLLRVFNKTIEVRPEQMDDAIDFLKRATWAAIKEYKTVWTSKPRYDEETGLSCYHPEGVGIPPETEASHFVALLKPYCEKYNLTHDQFIEKYNNDEIDEPDLDEYFLHDRAVRESGHDTSYRLEGKCAYLATVDLNSLLYKYEVDIAFIIDHFFNNSLQLPDGTVETKEYWEEKAQIRHENMTKYLWNEENSIYYDYNIKTKEQTGYESATTFWPLYARVATKEQAEALVKNSLHKFEEFGGLVAGTLKSRGDVGITRPSRQWDYPYGWAPQQILAWIGLNNYSYHGCARRLVYRWLYLMTKAFADYNGVVVEKYNVVQGATPHKVDAEYGNQGTDFKGVATEGFGWVNASYVFGLTFLNVHAKRNLGTLTQPEEFLTNMHPNQRAEYQ